MANKDTYIFWCTYLAVSPGTSDPRTRNWRHLDSEALNSIVVPTMFCLLYLYFLCLF